MRIYSPVNYSLGSDTSPEVARQTLSEMKASLSRWLSFRYRTDEKVGSNKYRAERFQDETVLAKKLYEYLLAAGFPSDELPVPDLVNDPYAAVRLAEIVVSSETPSPIPQGIFPLLIAAGGLVLVIGYWIKKRADVEAEKERLRCIQSGACTDYGFWLKLGSIGVLSYLAWNHFGLKKLGRA